MIILISNWWLIAVLLFSNERRGSRANVCNISNICKLYRSLERPVKAKPSHTIIMILYLHARGYGQPSFATAVSGLTVDKSAFFVFINHFETFIILLELVHFSFNESCCCIIHFHNSILSPTTSTLTNFPSLYTSDFLDVSFNGWLMGSEGHIVPLRASYPSMRLTLE